MLLLQRKDSERFRSWCHSGEAELSPGVTVGMSEQGPLELGGTWG